MEIQTKVGQLPRFESGFLLPCGCSPWSTGEPWWKVYISLQTLLSCGKEANGNWSDISWHFFLKIYQAGQQMEDHGAAENHLTQRGKNHWEWEELGIDVCFPSSYRRSFLGCPPWPLPVCVLTVNSLSSLSFLPWTLQPLLGLCFSASTLLPPSHHPGWTSLRVIFDFSIFLTDNCPCLSTMLFPPPLPYARQHPLFLHPDFTVLVQAVDNSSMGSYSGVYRLLLPVPGLCLLQGIQHILPH